MDHYRMVFNVAIPQLARVPNAPPVIKHKARHIKSAVAVLESSSPDRPRSATDPFDFLPRPIMPMRAPSAPAVAMKKSRPFSSVSLPSEKAKKEETVGRQSRVRIEVDGVETGHAHSRQSRAASSMSRWVFKINKHLNHKDATNKCTGALAFILDTLLLYFLRTD